MNKISRNTVVALTGIVVATAIASSYANAQRSPAVYDVSGRYLGQDPDANVRLQLKIDAEHQGW